MTGLEAKVPRDDAVTEWRRRIRLAERLREEFSDEVLATAEDDEAALRWLASVDPQAAVGSRHHVVPRFVLRRWANTSGRVQVFSKVERTVGVRNISDLAIKDFYTIIDNDGLRSSVMESMLSEMEAAAAAAIRDLLNPFAVPRPFHEHVATLAQFAAFQLVRTPRHRREAELHAEWYAKTMASGKIDEAELRELVIVPHQNEAISRMSHQSTGLFPLLFCRPIALVVLDGPRLFMGDEPVILNSPAGAIHVSDCFLTDAQIQTRMDKERRKKRKRQRPVQRVVHFSSTVPRGAGVASEIVLPISPRAALVWGPLHDSPHMGGIDRVEVSGPESERFAALANAAICNQALDWIVSTTSDRAFAARDFPEIGPLMRVCDGENAASLAVNQTPVRMRPARLWDETPR